MKPNPSALIDALGGTSKVARLMDVTPQSVHAWREEGIPHARLQTFQALALVFPHVRRALKKANLAKE